MDGAIRRYKEERIRAYRAFAEDVCQGRRYAVEAAREIFGRNRIATALGASRAMVTRSTPWQQIRKELGLGPKPAKGRPQRIGLDKAIEEKATDESVTPLDQAIRNETIEFIRESVPDGSAERIIERLERGKITDDQARELVRLSVDQARDDRARKIRQKP